MGTPKDEDIPSVRELEALEQKDRKETEDLLAGFDRPGRTPRTPRAHDFVDYYSGRSAPIRDAQPVRVDEKSPHEKPTVVVPRNEGFRGTIVWALAVAGMILFGASIAILATPSQPAPQAVPLSPATPMIAPTSATTITSANPQPHVSETTQDTVIVAPAPFATPKKTAPSTTVTGASSAAPIKTAPRDDFIRDM